MHFKIHQIQNSKSSKSSNSK